MEPSPFSTSVHATPRQPSSPASARPIGPPPAIRTGVSIYSGWTPAARIISPTVAVSSLIVAASSPAELATRSRPRPVMCFSVNAGVLRVGPTSSPILSSVGGDQGRDVRRSPFIGYVQEIQAFALVQRLVDEMRLAAVAEGAVIQLARLALGERHELAHILRRQAGMRQQEVIALQDERDRREAALGIVGQRLVEKAVGGEGLVHRGEERVAVGRGLRHRLGADVAARAGAVL